MSRPAWDEYFLQIAKDVARRATCDRLHVGAVITRGGRILSTGFNGAPRGLPHCDDVGHELKEMGGRSSCIRVVHAESNAVINAARDGVAIDGSTIYTTASPCYDCAKLIINAGINRVVYGEHYASRYGMSDDPVATLFQLAGVIFEQVEEKGSEIAAE